MRTVAKPFEDVLAAAFAELDLEARQIGQERVGEGDREGVFDDGVAVAREAFLVFGQRHAGERTAYQPLWFFDMITACVSCAS